MNVGTITNTRPVGALSTATPELLTFGFKQVVHNAKELMKEAEAAGQELAFKDAIALSQNMSLAFVAQAHDSVERQIDRNHRERMHQEKLEASREDLAWKSKLQKEFDQTLEALGKAIVLTFFLVATFNLVILVWPMKNFGLPVLESYMLSHCKEDASSYGGSFGKVMDYMSSISCFLAGWLSIATVAVFATLMMAFVLAFRKTIERLGLGSLLGSTMECAFMIMIMLACGLVRGYQVASLTVLLGTSFGVIFVRSWMIHSTAMSTLSAVKAPSKNEVEGHLQPMWHMRLFIKWVSPACVLAASVFVPTMA
jgi:hypothetical protein